MYTFLLMCCYSTINEDVEALASPGESDCIDGFASDGRTFGGGGSRDLGTRPALVFRRHLGSGSKMRWGAEEKR
jgi:hypothetical protein